MATKYSHLHCLLVFSIATWQLPVLNAQRSTPDDRKELIKHFLQEAPRKWRQYKDLCRHLNGSVQILSEVDGKPYERYRVTYKSNERCRLTYLDRQPKGSVDVLGFNSRYAFRLIKRKGKGWVLKEVQMLHRTDKSSIKSEAVQSADYLQMLVNGYGIELIKLVRQSSFRVTQIDLKPRDGRQLWQIAFDNSHPVDQEPFFPVQKGRLLLDPDRYWYLVSAEYYAVYGSQNHKQLSFEKVEATIADSPSQYPIPKTVTVRSKQQRPNRTLTYVTHFSFDVNKPPKPVPEREFTLSAFGLPEPPGVDWTPPTPWYFYAGAAAIAMLVLGGAAAWLRQRLANRAA